MARDKILIWGMDTDHCLLYDLIQSMNFVKIAFMDDSYLLYQTGQWQRSYPSSEWYAFCAIEDIEKRSEVITRLHDNNYVTPNLVHGKTHISPRSILRENANIYIGPGTVVAPHSTISQGAFINMNTTIDYDVFIGECVNLQHNIVVEKMSIVEDFCDIKSNAVLRPNTKMEKWTRLLENSVITDQIYGSKSVWGGTPATMKGYIGRYNDYS